MSLNAQQKEALKPLLCTLLDYDEPEAILATLQRIAELEAYGATRERARLEAMRWQALADALAKTSAALKLERSLVTDI